MAGCTSFSNFASLTHSKGNAYVIHFIMCFCGGCNVGTVIKTQRKKVCFIFTLMKQKEWATQQERERGGGGTDKGVGKWIKVYTRVISMWVARVANIVPLSVWCFKWRSVDLFSQPLVHIHSYLLIFSLFIKIKLPSTVSSLHWHLSNCCTLSRFKSSFSNKHQGNLLRYKRQEMNLIASLNIMVLK